MSQHVVYPRASGARFHSRVGALSLALLMLLSACATGAPEGRALTAYRDPSRTTGESSDASTPGARGGVGEALFVKLPTDFDPVRVSDTQFRGALVDLLLDMPLRVATSHPPLYVGRNLALVSAPLEGEAWRSELARAYGRFCERRGSPGDCLTLFDDGPHLHNTENVIALDEAVHTRISAWYSSKPGNLRMTIREWVGQRSYEAQREYGLSVLRDFGGIP